MEGQERGPKQPWAGVMGAGGGETSGEHRRIPLKNKANQYLPQPGRFKSLSTKPAPPSVGGTSGRRAVWTLLWEGALCLAGSGGGADHG